MNDGYHDVGMDNFTLEGDRLLQSKIDGTLHRNFMGSATTKTELLIGLGVSAISDVYFGYRQNYKTVEEYYAAVNLNLLPIHKGINLEDDDILCRAQILNISCRGRPI